MKLDFMYLDRVRQHLQLQSKVDPKEYAEGRYVYEIRFCPSSGKCEIHMQWPMFRNLITNESDRPVEVDRLAYGSSPAVLHMTGWVQGVEIRVCVDKHEIINDLKECLGDNYEAYEVHEDEDILALFTLWQNMTGWNLGWPGQKEAQPNG